MKEPTFAEWDRYERELKTRPLCPTCGRRGSEREVCVPGTPPYDDEMHGEVCPSPFHDAADYGPVLLEAARAYCELTVCYRINRTPSEALFARLDKAKEVLARVGRKEEE
jgi:hypothetical protein